MQTLETERLILRPLPMPATRRWAPRRGGTPTGAWRRAGR